MRIFELCEATGVPRATVKYYLREGLLHPGEPVSRTQAEYGQGHVDRIRLVRALTDVAGLRLEEVRRVFAAIDRPDVTRRGLMAAAAQAALPPDAAAGAPAPDGTRARDWLAARGWRVETEGPLVGELDRTLLACDQAGVPISEERLSGYADAAEAIAALDLDSVPQDVHAAVRQVVLGTLLVDPVLACLRRLAQQHVSVSRATEPG